MRRNFSFWRFFLSVAKKNKKKPKTKEVEWEWRKNVKKSSVK